MKTLYLPGLLCTFAAMCCMPYISCESVAGAEVAAGSATVKADTIAVYSGMSLSGKPVKSLKKGDAVRVEYEVEGSGEAWCGIDEEGQSSFTGYVLCKYLERYDPGRIKWQHVGPFAERPVSNITNVTISGNQVLVPVTLGYKGKTVDALLLLDTGASVSMINTEIADRLGINRVETKAGVGQVVGGGLIFVYRAILDHMSVGPRTVSGFEIGVVRHQGPPVGFDGLLGMDFLRDLKYDLDFKNHIISWKDN